MESNPIDLSTIYELARTDPIWQKVLDQEANTPQIKFFSMTSRMSDERMFAGIENTAREKSADTRQGDHSKLQNTAEPSEIVRWNASRRVFTVLGMVGRGESNFYHKLLIYC